MTTRFRKLPVEVEAVRWTGDNDQEIADFVGPYHYEGDVDPRPEPPRGWEFMGKFRSHVWDEAHQAWDPLNIGDWIIKGVTGEFYPCADHVRVLSFEEIGPVTDFDTLLADLVAAVPEVPTAIISGLRAEHERLVRRIAADEQFIYDRAVEFGAHLRMDAPSDGTEQRPTSAATA